MNNRPNLKVNTALKAVLDTLYGSEMNQRRLAEERQQFKAKSGENNGLHKRGNEEIDPLVDEGEEQELNFLITARERENNKDGKKSSSSGSRRRRCEDEENGWKSLYSVHNQPGWEDGRYNSRSSNNKNSGSGVSIRRNIVLDDCDQRYQLSLGLTRCTYTKNNHHQQGGSNPGVLDVELCLLAMEEDEVDDSGFPTFINEGEDDEALICTSSDRIHSCVESSVRIVPKSALEEGVSGRNDNAFGRKEEGHVVKEVTLSRGMIGQDGSVRFRIDLNKALDDAVIPGNEEGGDGNDDGAGYHIVKLKFRHADTGAVLELRIPSQDDTDDADDDGEDEIEFCGTKPAVARNDASRFLLNGHDDEDNEPNEYEDDGFLVNSQDSDEEDEFHSDNEEDEHGECEICKGHGDLIVCDGGDNEGGCGHSYHIHCIGRDVIPPGKSSTITWILYSLLSNLTSMKCMIS